MGGHAETKITPELDTGIEGLLVRDSPVSLRFVLFYIFANIINLCNCVGLISS